MFAIRGVIQRCFLISLVGAIVVILISYHLMFKKFVIIGESIECSTNSPFPFEYTCELDNIDNFTQSWTFEGNIPAGLEMPAMLARITTSKKIAGTYIPKYFINETINVCKHSGGRISKMMINKFLPNMNNPNVSNLNRPCPLKGAVFLRNFQFDGPIKLPRSFGGDWHIEMKSYAEGFDEITFNMDIYLKFQPVGLF